MERSSRKIVCITQELLIRVLSICNLASNIKKMADDLQDFTKLKVSAGLYLLLRVLLYVLCKLKDYTFHSNFKLNVETSIGEKVRIK